MSTPARAPWWRQAGRRAGVVLAAGALLSGCSDGLRDPAAERGRQVYLAQCIACHNSNPALPGAVGPEVKGASRALLEDKIVRGTYPPGYTPKRPTRIMPPQPGLAPDVDGLAAFLK